ncbi:unnamed protein product [Adineta ricciae]|uniref:CCHC-type domain-containing protein n=1 Tax=Adineta ricciae TaxID=249248 RepID=A0A815SVH0_ADIRI|nr:unnamed protein product [Adineta ricciae]CAF1498003.1 unnamed protein product [Adineta ricciae]
MAGDETKATMTVEEAIKEIRSMQLQHDSDIKTTGESIQKIQAKIATSNDETNKKMKEEFQNINEQLTSQITSIHAQVNTTLTNLKQEMAKFMVEEIQKLNSEKQTVRVESNDSLTTLIKEIKEMKRDIADIRNVQSNDDHVQQLDSHPNGVLFSSTSKQFQQDQNTPSTTLNNDVLSIHSNSSILNNNRPQTVFLPTSTNAPVFHGKPTDRPWQFLIRIEEYTETVHMWGEDLLLRGISQFLKDTALDWYCQLRSCNCLPRTWAEFKQAFVKQFNSPIRIAQKIQEWKECKQNQDETMNEFIIRLRALWIEQFPLETETDLIKHLFCKMRPDILNIMGCPKINSLQEILTEAQRVEEIIYHRQKQYNTGKRTFSNSNYNNNNNYYKNNNSIPKPNDWSQTNNNGAYKNDRQQTQGNQESQQQKVCYYCGKYNHQSRDCWYKKQSSTVDSDQTTSTSKNE